MNSNKLEIRGSQEEGFYVENLHSIYIETLDELMSLLKEGELNRATASHILNEHSPRSKTPANIASEVLAVSVASTIQLW